MTLYSCNYCNFTTKSKFNYNRHLNTKKHKTIIKSTKEIGGENAIKKKEQKMNTNEHKNEHKRTQMNTNEHKKKHKKEHNKFKCKFCNTTFNTKPSMRRHENYYCTHLENKCSAMKRMRYQMEREKHKMRKQFEKEKNKLYKQIEMLIEKTGNTTINNNIQLNNFGDEDTTYITDNVMDKLLLYPGTMISNLLELTHFNKDHPENKNLKITNKKSKYIKVFKGDEWKLDKKDIEIDNLMNIKYEQLDDYYEEKGKDKMKNTHKVRFEVYKDNIEDENKELLSDIKDSLELSIINNS